MFYCGRQPFHCCRLAQLASLIYYNGMIALQILDIKKFMSAFLIGSLFDRYALIEAQITTFCTFSIDGRMEKLFYENRTGGAAEDEEDAGGPLQYVPFEQLRPYCLSVIKGKHTPLFFKFVFFYPKEELPAFIKAAAPQTDPDLISGLCLNLRFDGSTLTLTTGTSMKVFTTDRTIDRAWDEKVRQLLISQNILVSEV